MLVGYIRRDPAPLSVVACVLLALRGEVRVRERTRSAESTLELRGALRRFTELQAALLEALAEAARTAGTSVNRLGLGLSISRAGSTGVAHASGARGVASAEWLARVLDPQQVT